MDWRLVGTVLAMGIYFLVMLFLLFLAVEGIKIIRREQNDIKKRLGKARVREQKILKAIKRKGVKTQ